MNDADPRSGNNVSSIESTYFRTLRLLGELRLWAEVNKSTCSLLSFSKLIYVP